MKFTAYRIVKKKFSDSIWTGEGACCTGGRWTSPGMAVVYTADNQSLAVLEQLVDMKPPRNLKGFVIASIRFDEADVKRIHRRNLPRGWDRPKAPLSLRKIGDQWMRDERYPILAVPNAITLNEWNYLFNPAHPAFRKMRKSPTRPFLFDPRLK